ncbi:MAG: tRNA epoxyqueuosine(34) reductase QueG [Phycisphaerae bacterium]|nr:tRNA epoxyqueuosine(34) reductase QueG [Phycisphaerae bacterium]
MSPLEITTRIKALAAEQGFCRTGIAPVEPLDRANYYKQWLAAGRHGRMHYLSRNLGIRFHPSRILEGARSMVVVAHPYRRQVPDRRDSSPCGRVAMYAWGKDYHKVVRRKLFAVCDRLREEIPHPFETRVCVDTAPIVERALAARAGIGWIGKNTMVIDPQVGSYFFVGVIATTLELVADVPIGDQCGSCTRCLQACPTGALLRPYEMDASRCVSYLTIELRESIPQELQAAMGDWVFGCDMCQEVCPYNRKPQLQHDPAYAIKPPCPFPSLMELCTWDDDDYAKALAGSALKRATPAMLRRNAEIARRNIACDTR